VVQLPIALADPVRGNIGSGCQQADAAKHVGLPKIANNPFPQINAELLLVCTHNSFNFI
jgi:hypothetical protein